MIEFIIVGLIASFVSQILGNYEEYSIKIPQKTDNGYTLGFVGGLIIGGVTSLFVYYFHLYLEASRIIGVIGAFVSSLVVCLIIESTRKTIQAIKEADENNSNGENKHNSQKNSKRREDKKGIF